MINKWRKEELHLAATDLDRIHDKHIVTLYFFSENIVYANLCIACLAQLAFRLISVLQCSTAGLARLGPDHRALGIREGGKRLETAS